MFFFLLASNSSFGQQNLILNGDFEEYWECPNETAQIARCKFVYNPLPNGPIGFSSTSDYFNSCSNTFSANTNVPNAVFGYQEPRSGNGYCGFSFEDYGNNLYYSEYIQIELSEPLKPFFTYKIKGYFNLANNWSYTSTDIHFKLVPDLVIYNDFLSEFMSPDYKNITTIVSDTIEWTEISFDFIAKGGEKYLIIGDFNNGLNTNFIYLYNELITTKSVYFYVDDVSIIQINEADPIVFSNVFTPNSDGVNDFFEIISGKEQIESFVIINRWGEKVFQSDSLNTWNGKDIKGLELSEGVYFINATLKNYEEKRQYNGTVHLIR